MQRRWSTADTAWRAVSTVGVDETDGDACVCCPGPHDEGERLTGDRLAGRYYPSFPFVGMSRLVVGME